MDRAVSAVSRGQSPSMHTKQNRDFRTSTRMRTENMLVLENIRTSTKSLKEQTILWWCCSAFKYTETGQLESCVRCLIGSHPILMLALLKTGRPMVCKPIHHGRTHATCRRRTDLCNRTQCGMDLYGSGDARCPSWQGSDVFGTYRCENRSSSCHEAQIRPTFWTPRNKALQYSTVLEPSTQITVVRSK
jgi:hypothetical protein